ncbi:hypothetical protein KSP39_PZI007408 [Platanthera zijinensis]|uniref:Uncharacterized protein n=1 Tax=Platanthera zijinensis TaxID=2320716 RepID=A0AAP0BNQ9_9ASPA
MSISPSLSPRQCPDRYAFRAGRNLPDKEFRYLRTVIVMAAVHRGFGRRLPCHQVTNFLLSYLVISLRVLPFLSHYSFPSLVIVFAGGGFAVMNSSGVLFFYPILFLDFWTFRDEVSWFPATKEDSLFSRGHIIPGFVFTSRWPCHEILSSHLIESLRKETYEFIIHRQTL